MDTSTKTKLNQRQLEEVVTAALKSHPALGDVTHVGIVRLYGGLPNWDLWSIAPELSREQYRAVNEIIGGLRIAYLLRDEVS